MTMTAAFDHKSSADIRSRLSEIGRLETSHAARDMDAELAEVMRKGGDIDALEAKQLDAERLSRRLRAERMALEVELPLAVQREAKAFVGASEEKHRKLADKASEAASAVAAAWTAFADALNEWERIQIEAEEITSEAWNKAKTGNVEMPQLGRFISSKVYSLAEPAAFVDRRLAAAFNEMPVGGRVQGHRIDG